MANQGINRDRVRYINVQRLSEDSRERESVCVILVEGDYAPGRRRQYAVST